jgi:phage-related minor tail protein
MANSAKFEMTTEIGFELGRTVSNLDKVDKQVTGLVKTVETPHALDLDTTKAAEGTRKVESGLVGIADKSDFSGIGTTLAKEMIKAVDGFDTVADSATALGDDLAKGLGVDLADIFGSPEEAVKVLTGIQSEQKKALATLEVGGKRGSKEYEDLARSIQRTGNEIIDLRKKSSKTPVAEPDPDPLEQTLDFYKQLIQEAETLGGVSKREAKQIEQGIEGQQDALQDVIAAQQKQMKELIEAGGRGTKEYGEISDSIEENKRRLQEFHDLIEKTPRVPDPLGNLAIGEGVSRVGEQLEQFSQKGIEARAALKQLRIETGLTKEEAKALGAEADQAFRGGVGESAADAVKTISAVKLSLGNVIPKDQFDAAAKFGEGLGKAVGAGADEALAKSQTFFTTFDKGGINFQKTTDLLALGAQKARTSQADYLDTISEYSPLLAKAGFSAEAFIGTLARAGDEGTFSLDKVADAAKEAQIRLRAGDTRTAFTDIAKALPAQLRKDVDALIAAGESGAKSSYEVMQGVAQAAEEAFSKGQIGEQIRTQLATTIAGTPAEDLGTDLYQRLFSAPINEEELRKQAEQAGKTLSDGIAPSGLFDSIGRQVDAVMAKVGGFLAPVTQGVGSLLSTVGQVGPGLASFSQLIGGKEGLVGAIGKVGSGFGAAGSSIGAFATGPVGIALAVIAALVAAFVLLYTNSETFRKAVDKLWAKVKEFVATMAEKLRPIMEKIGIIFSKVAGVVGDIFGRIISVVVRKVEEFVIWVGKGVEKLGDWIASMLGMSDAGELVTAIIAGINYDLDLMIKVLDSAGAAIDGFIALVKSLGGSAVEALEALVNLDFEGFADKISNAFGKAGEEAEKAFRKTRMDDAAEDAANQILDGLVVGMEKRLGDAEKAGKLTGEAIETALREQWAGLQMPAIQMAIDAGRIDGEDVKKTQDKLKEIAERYRKAIRGTGGGGSIITPPTEKELSDLSSAYLGLFREVEKGRREVATLSIQDEFKKQQKAIQDGIDEAKGTAKDALGDIRKQVNESKDGVTIDLNLNAKIDSGETFGKGSAEAIAKFEALINERLRLAKEKAEVDLEKLTRDFVKSRLDAWQASQKEITDRELAALALEHDLIAGEDVNALIKRGQLRLEILDRQQEAELNQLAATTPEFQAEASRLQRLYLEGALTEEALKVEIDRTLEAVKAGNAGLLRQREKLELDQARMMRESAIAVEDFRISLMSEGAEKEAAARRLAIARTLNEELNRVGANTELQHQARTRAAVATYDVEVDYLNKTDEVYKAATAVRVGFLEAFGSMQDNERTRQLQSEIDTLEASRDAFFSSNEAKALNAQEYRDKINEYNQQIADKQAELETKKFDIGFTLAQGLVNAGKEFEKKKGEDLAESQAKLTDLSKAGLAFSAEAADAQLGMLADAGEQTAAQLAGALGSMLQGAEVSTKELSKIVLNNLLDLANREVDIFVPMAYMKGIEFLGPIAGPIAATISIALVKGLLAVGRSAVAGLALGIDEVPGNRAKRDSQLYYLDPGEAVIDRLNADRERGLIRYIRRGGRSADYNAKQLAGRFADRQAVDTMMAGQRALIDQLQAGQHQLSRDLAGVKTVLGRIAAPASKKSKKGGDGGSMTVKFQSIGGRTLAPVVESYHVDRNSL